MASYEELSALVNKASFKAKIQVACIIAAEGVRVESDTTDNHINRLSWAKKVFESPKREAGRMLWAVVAANKDATISNITGAPDSTIQTQVNLVIDIFAGGS